MPVECLRTGVYPGDTLVFSLIVSLILSLVVSRVAHQTGEQAKDTLE
jgi:hypothetical protein